MGKGRLKEVERLVPQMPHLLVLHCLVHSSLGQPSSVIEVACSDSLREIILHITELNRKV